MVIPAWGADFVALLPVAVGSVKAQNRPVTIVVVDNASEVAVPPLPGVTIVRSPRRLSAGEARNLGLEHVATEYVVLLDADDELVAGMLEALEAGIASDPGIAVYATSLLEAATGTRHRSPRRFVGALTRLPRLFALLTAIWSLYPIQGNAIMRTRWIREAGGYADCSGGEDWVLAVSQAFRGRVVVDRRPGLIYHARPDSLWRRSRGTGDLLAAARRVRGHLRTDPGVPRWARALLPLIAAAQSVLIVLVRPAYRALRRGDRGDGQSDQSRRT